MSDSNSPAPFVYSPSQEFNGNDGKWSTFTIRVGSPAQTFRVLPSPITGEVLVPISEGCSLPSDPKNCGQLRGAYDFNGLESKGLEVNQSSTWHQIGIYDMDMRPELEFNANGMYGLDNVGLMVPHSGGPEFTNQVVGSFANKRVFMGTLGLGPKPANFSEFENPQRSLLQSLVGEKRVPSRSWGYTAGAFYKTPKAMGSLTFGGYDQSRLEPNNITFPMDPNDSRPLSLKIQSLSARDTFNGSTNLQPEQIYVQIDFTVPHLWLPKETCDRFATAFGLLYDNTTDLYTVNATTHAKLQQLNPTITFGFGATANPVDRVNVALPYSAFDLQAEWPIYPNATNYFPIRRAYNETQYTLGRAFMQEAYLTADFERGNFSLYQARFPETTDKQDIVPILLPSPPSSQKETPKPPPGITLSHAAIASIAVGASLFLILLAILFIWYRRRQRQHRREAEELARQQQQQQQIPHVTIAQQELPTEEKYEVNGIPFLEMDGLGLVELGAPRTREGTRETSMVEVESRRGFYVGLEWHFECVSGVAGGE